MSFPVHVPVPVPVTVASSALPSGLPAVRPPAVPSVVLPMVSPMVSPTLRPAVSSAPFPAPAPAVRRRHLRLSTVASRLAVLFLSLGASLVAAGPHGSGDPGGWRGASDRHLVRVPVLDVQPQYERVRVSRTSCDVVVDHTSVHVRRPDPAGPLVGAVFGGLLGSQLGDPGHRTAAATVGVIVGAVAGDALSRAEARHAGPPVQRSRHCRELVHWDHRPAGFLVTYALAGRTHTVHMDRHPGAMLSLDVGVAEPRHGGRHRGGRPGRWHGDVHRDGLH